MSAFLQLSQVGKTFARGGAVVDVLRDVSLDIEKGAFVCLIGPPLSGKSTLLNIVAGHAGATSGQVILDGHVVDAPGPDRALVVRSHSLLPWLTVYENVRLAVDKVFAGTRPETERHEATLHMLDLVGMDEARDRRPSELSGGMRQRVGIARALAVEPKVLLLDEPFGAVDPLTRAELQDIVGEIHQALGTTTLMVPHDVDEAVHLSDRIVMMTDGPAAHIGAVREIDLPRPRARPELVAIPSYLDARAAVLNFLHERNRAVEAA